jgi:hypothetical protein
MLLTREEAERKLAPGINIYVWNFQLLTVSKIVGVVQVHRLVSDLHAGHDFAIPGASSDLYSLALRRYFSTDVRSSRVIDHHAIRILNRRDSMCLRPRSSRLLWAFL